MDPHLDRAYPEKLSEWNLFTATRPHLRPNAGVLPYTVNTPLFSDYATKYRTVWMPGGTSAGYASKGPLAFPVGTVLTKTFSFPQRDGTERLIETRLLVLQRSGWIALGYVWNREQTEAVLDTSPLPVPVRWVDAVGREHATDYMIPNPNQCTLCHDQGAPLGPTARNLNHGDQLAQWTRAGYLKSMPAGNTVPRQAVWNDPASPLSDRARAYLEMNCATCHRAATKAQPLDLHHTTEILRRMESTDPEKMMPTVGHTVPHREGVELIRQWIAAGCP